MTKHRNAITILETLIAVAIIAVLVALLLPAVHQTRCGGGRRTQCKNNQKNIGLALWNTQETVASPFVLSSGAYATNPPPFLKRRGPVEVDHVDLVEHPERYTGKNRPWWLVEDVVSESSADGSL